MATTALSFSSFRVLCAGARPKNKSGPRRKPFPKKPAEPPKPNLSTTPSSRSASSRTVLPTTYAKLPLLDDEDDPMEITLEEFEKMRKELKKKVQKKKQPTRNANVSRFVQDILDDDDDDDDDEMEDFEADTFSGEDEEEGEEIFLDSGFDSKPESKSPQNWDEEEEEGEEGKEKGVPAVMRCFDTAKIYAKAGDGGNGVVAFRREKFVPYGGPSGGDGGQGGQIYVEVDPSINSLLPFRKTLHFRAGRGSHGQGSKQGGAKGEDVVIMVPPGTVIREAVKGESGEGEKLLELLGPGQKALLLPGGRGGRGNASFKTGNNKVPKIAERGEEGAEMWLELEMKLVADVGIVGAPNAGKSTLLAAVSAAQPEIASYPFTTLLPNLGVVSLDFHATMVVADLPGLLEGAHRGYGLGHEFLRHSERCHTLIHVVDGSGEQPEYEYDAVRLELELFSPTLAEKPYIVLFNKMDLSEAFDKWESFERKLKKNGIRVYCGSAINKQGTHEVISSAYELLQKERKGKKKVEEWEGEQDLNHVAETIRKEKSVPMSEFEISHQNGPNGTMTWIVDGAGIQRFVQMTNWRYSESLRRFQSALEACGVNKYLIKSGVKEGDTVIVGEMELIWHDEHEKEGRRTKSSSKGRSGEGSIKWPKF